MKQIILFMAALLVATYGQAKSTYKAWVKDSKTKEPVTGAVVNIAGTTIGNIADEHGLVVLEDVPDGVQVVEFRFTGYELRSDSVAIPQAISDTPVIYLEAAEDELEGVVVNTTRSTRTIRDIPTRIEVIGGEELDEKGNMKPGDIRMLLSESTGIQTLQTSATSGNSSIRIEGLDGRYTQILKDGFPLYAGFSGGLGLLQTPPLDLKQVEIVKGSSSTLYGGGAIAGLLNLVSKTPGEKRELRFMINGTSAKGLDLNGFYSQRFGKVGLTLYAGYDANTAEDPAGIGLSAIPEFQRYTFNPRMFMYLGKNTELIVGGNVSIEKRIGGDMEYIEGRGDSAHSYFEDNVSQRYSSQLELKHKMADGSTLNFKNSVDRFHRTITMPAYEFEGTQLSSFTELSYARHGEHTEWVAGGNFFTDGFKDKPGSVALLRDYSQQTPGAFAQATHDLSSKLIVEAGLRGDYVFDYGFAVLPRISLLCKVSSKLTTRIGGGLGYKTPTIFTEESERIQYRNVLPISADSNHLEKSYGANWDVNYRTTLANGTVTLAVNQLIFYTRLNDPLQLMPDGSGMYRFRNLDAHIDAQGAETNVKLGYKHFKLFLGYTFTSSFVHSGSATSETPLTPRHHTNSVLTYELEGKLKVGLEAYYYSRQLLSDGTRGRDYWLCGVMAEKLWKKFSLFINFENFLDSRQTRFGSIYSGTITNPVFRDIYAPLDGFVVNGGLKLNL